MVIGEVLTGIALVKQSVDFIKSNINTAKDIGEIAKQIDDLFEGKKQIDRKRNKKSGMSVGQQLGVSSVASEIIDAKLAAEKLYEISILVDMRFGNGTWASIIAERNKRIQAAKEAAKKEARERAEKNQEIAEVAMVALAIAVAAALLVGVVYILTR
tara:strand:- start:318 stop:788 length:471 start_codon:yes stop_codon:yes gene_type:complete